MSVNVVVGKAGSGKSIVLAHHLKKSAEVGKKCLLYPESREEGLLLMQRVQLEPFALSNVQIVESDMQLVTELVTELLKDDTENLEVFIDTTGKIIEGIALIDGICLAKGIPLWVTSQCNANAQITLGIARGAFDASRGMYKILNLKEVSIDEYR